MTEEQSSSETPQEEETRREVSEAEFRLVIVETIKGACKWFWGAVFVMMLVWLFDFYC